jgi:hypothetical protein
LCEFYEAKVEDQKIAEMDNSFYFPDKSCLGKNSLALLPVLFLKSLEK